MPEYSKLSLYEWLFGSKKPSPSPIPDPAPVVPPVVEPIPIPVSPELKRKEINVIVLDDLDKKFIENALSIVPGYWKFVYAPAESSQTETWNTMGMWANFPFPKDPNTIVFFNGTKRKVNAGGGATSNFRVGCGIFDADIHEMDVGLRVWHELLHTENASADIMTHNPVFDLWLPGEMRTVFVKNKELYAHSQFWEMNYYLFLMSELIENK